MDYTIIIQSFLTAATAIIIGWFTYNQRSKDKKTDLKIENVRRENEKHVSKSNRDIAIIYGELWTLLGLLDADRCFIIQPYPEKKHMFITAVFEVTKKGVSHVRDIIKDIPVSEVASFTKELATKKFLEYDDIDKQVKDLKIKSLMRIAGTTNIHIQQMTNLHDEWIGSLVIENTFGKELDERARDMMRSVAQVIQFILPPIN